jgi:hypothetical protein
LREENRRASCFIERTVEHLDLSPPPLKKVLLTIEEQGQTFLKGHKGKYLC